MSILVALDQSEIAKDVLAAIGPYLRRTMTEAHLVTVVEPGEVERAARAGRQHFEMDRGVDMSGGRVSPAAATPDTPLTRTQAIDQVVEQHRAELQQLAHEHLEGLVTRAHVEVADDVPQAIVDLADRLAVNTIAIGTRGRSGIRRALLGSVAEQVIRKSNVPVFVIRRGMRLPPEADGA